MLLRAIVVALTGAEAAASSLSAGSAACVELVAGDEGALALSPQLAKSATQQRMERREARRDSGMA